MTRARDKLQTGSRRTENVKGTWCGRTVQKEGRKTTANSQKTEEEKKKKLGASRGRGRSHPERKKNLLFIRVAEGKKGGEKGGERVTDQIDEPWSRSRNEQQTHLKGEGETRR